ncbi:MAG: hypothetical protein AAF141_15365 [Pseudomonadota bacterium]
MTFLYKRAASWPAPLPPSIGSAADTKAVTLLILILVAIAATELAERSAAAPHLEPEGVM